MTQRLRIEPNKREVLSLIEEIDYPRKDWLDHPEWIDACTVFRISDDFGTVGFIWVHKTADREMTAHFGLLPGCSLDWPVMLSKFLDIAYLFGADWVILAFNGNPRAKALCRLVSRLGFEHQPDNQHDNPLLYRIRTDGK